MEKKKNTGQLAAVLILAALLLLAIGTFLLVSMSQGAEKLSRNQERVEEFSAENENVPAEDIQTEPVPMESFTVTNGNNDSAKADSQSKDEEAEDEEDQKKDKDEAQDGKDEEESDYLCDYSAERLITEDDVEELKAGTYEGLPEGKNICQMVINELYARHGYQFSNEDIQNYFNQKEWYQNIPTRNTDMGSIFQGMSDIEKKNVEFLSPYGEEE